MNLCSMEYLNVIRMSEKFRKDRSKGMINDNMHSVLRNYISKLILMII
jgi:hypothetical protein